MVQSEAINTSNEPFHLDVVETVDARRHRRRKRGRDVFLVDEFRSHSRLLLTDHPHILLVRNRRVGRSDHIGIVLPECHDRLLRSNTPRAEKDFVTAEVRDGENDF
jgi:hypothetical protein